MFFGAMISVWKYFLLFPQRSRIIEGIQAVLGFPELKILKPCDTRLLSHDRCVKGGLTHFPPKFAHFFFVPVITFPPFLL